VSLHAFRSLTVSNPEKENALTVDFDDRIFPLSEIADASNLSIATLRRRIADGTGPKVTQTSERRIGVRGRHYREWLDTQCAKPGPRPI
jgi:predicted DNA-binding transcriptional regulator AlpA